MNGISELPDCGEIAEDPSGERKRAANGISELPDCGEIADNIAPPPARQAAGEPQENAA